MGTPKFRHLAGEVRMQLCTKTVLLPRRREPCPNSSSSCPAVGRNNGNLWSLDWRVVVAACHSRGRGDARSPSRAVDDVRRQDRRSPVTEPTRTGTGQLGMQSPMPDVAACPSTIKVRGRMTRFAAAKSRPSGSCTLSQQQNCREASSRHQPATLVEPAWGNQIERLVAASHATSSQHFDILAM